MTVKLGYVI